MPRDILEKAPPGLNLSDDASDVGPEVAGVVLALSLSRLGKRLAWVSGEHGVDMPSPRAGVECLEVVPDRGGREVSGPLPSDEGLPGVVLDLDVSGGGKARLGKLKAHVKSAAACAEGEAVSGR